VKLIFGQIAALQQDYYCLNLSFCADYEQAGGTANAVTSLPDDVAVFSLWESGNDLAPARDGNPEQERHEQARERRFPCDGADGRERLSRLPRSSDGVAQAIDRCPKRGCDVRDGARNIGGGIHGAFGDTRLRRHLRGFNAHIMLACRCLQSSIRLIWAMNERGRHHGYPRQAPLLAAGLATIGYPRQALR
jgi:hypothetical protein